MRIAVTAVLAFELEFEISDNTHQNGVLEAIYEETWSDQIKNAADIGRYDINDVYVFDDDGNQIY